LYGFHRNAEIATNFNDSESMVANLRSIQPQISTTGSGEASDSKLIDNIKNIYNQIPELWDLETFEENYPTIYEESMNTVLNQEAVK